MLTPFDRNQPYMSELASVPCVCVPPKRGETTRQALADAGLLDAAYAITSIDGRLCIPVTDPESAATVFDSEDVDVTVASHPLPRRSKPESPADILGYEPSIDRLGDIVILDEDDPDVVREIADAVLSSHVPARTIVNRASPIQGELRIREWDVLVTDTESGLKPTETVHKEYGHEFLVDISEMYFSPRLATERNRVSEQISAGEHVFDMFAGAGPFAIPAATRGADVVAVDLNETAIEYLTTNAARNGVTDRITAHCGDVRDVGTEYANWADRIVMNLPHSADAFVETAIAIAGDSCVIHYYDIQSSDNPFAPGIERFETAAAGAYTVTVVGETVVRSYSPQEVNVCLDLRLDRIAE